MKNLIPVSILGLCVLSVLFLAFTDSSESKILSQLNKTKTVIADQTLCIDDLEASLYDFSYEISDLRAQNEFLVEENKNLRIELRSHAQKAAQLRVEMRAYEMENYNVKRQLEQVLIGREIRARQESNNSPSVPIADLMPSPDTEMAGSETVVAIQEMKTKMKTIASEIEVRREALEDIQIVTEETTAAIEANEAKIEFNIEMEPASDLAVEYTDPLVSQEVLFPAPTEESNDDTRFFTELSMEDEALASVDAEDEFSSKSPIFSLVENTNVVYNYIACRNDRYGKKIKKLRKGAKNWKYTFLQFNLETENINLLLNKEFRMRVRKSKQFHTTILCMKESLSRCHSSTKK